MSRLKELISHFAESQRTVLVHIPSKGYMWAKVVSIEDDLVTLDPEKENRIVIHYSQFSIKEE